MTAANVTVQCAGCCWEGDPAAAKTGGIHYEPFTRDDGTQHDVTVMDYRCPQCGSGDLAMWPRFDGRTGRPLVPLTAEERREGVQRTIESTRRYIRDQKWWRHYPRKLIERARVLLHWGTR
jgi:hypothetical protein